MRRKRIVIVIDEDGEEKQEYFGFVGNECELETKRLMADDDYRIEERHLKPEYFQKRGVKTEGR